MDYDSQSYVELLADCCATVLSPFGVDKKVLMSRGVATNMGLNSVVTVTGRDTWKTFTKRSKSESLALSLLSHHSERTLKL